MNAIKFAKANRILAFLACLTFCLKAGAQRFEQKMNLDAGLPCVHLECSNLQWRGGRDSFNIFLDKLDSLNKGTRRNVNVWHIGGSHVQAGVFSYRMTENLETLNPGMMGDRGFVFPVSLANTNGDKSYSIETKGKWSGSKLSLNSTRNSPRFGITGFAATTWDAEAQISFNLNSPFDKCWTFRRVRIMGYASDPASAYPCIFTERGDSLPYIYDASTSSFLFELPEETDHLTIGFRIKPGGSFTLTGILPISDRAGINYFSSGVNGASTRTWLDNAVDLERDMDIVKPDICIFGLGINDSACPSDRFKPEVFMDNCERLIRMVLRHSPSCTFIFMSTNDSYYYTGKGRPMAYNMNAPAVRRVMCQLAGKYKCAFWDIYGIMGGKESVDSWRDEGLVRDDHLHFTNRGYELLGDLLYNAIAWEYNKHE